MEHQVLILHAQGNFLPYLGRFDAILKYVDALNFTTNDSEEELLLQLIHNADSRKGKSLTTGELQLEFEKDIRDHIRKLTQTGREGWLDDAQLMLQFVSKTVDNFVAIFGAVTLLIANLATAYILLIEAWIRNDSINRANALLDAALVRFPDETERFSGVQRVKIHHFRLTSFLNGK